MTRRLKSDKVLQENFERVEGLITAPSYGQIARACAITQRMVSRVIRGKKNASIQTGLRITRFLGVTLEEFAFYQDVRRKGKIVGASEEKRNGADETPRG